MSTYSRMFIGVILGLLSVKLIVGSAGMEAFGLIALLGQATGFGAIVNDVVRYCLVRELGVAYHSDNARLLSEIFGATLYIGLGVAILTLAMFGGIFLLLPMLSIPSDLDRAARWFLIAMGLATFVQTLLAAPINLLLVGERMIDYNKWVLLTRVAGFVAALAVVAVNGVLAVPSALVVYATVSAGLTILFTVWAATKSVRNEPRISWRPGPYRHADIRMVLSSSGWNAGTVVANAMQLRMHAVIMNLAFGLLGNFVFGIASQLMAYVRTIASGSLLGIDAVTARVQSRSETDGVERVVYHSVRVAAFVTWPACIIIFVFAPALVDAWVGQSPQATEASLDTAALIVRILAPGILAWGIGDTWSRVLYGAGHIRRYAPILILAGLLNPICAVVVLQLNVGDHRLLVPAGVFSIINILTYQIAIPLVASRVLQTPAHRIWLPLSGPTFTALILAIPFIWLATPASSSLLFVLLSSIAYGFAYLIAAWFIVLHQSERSRIKQLFRRISKRSAI